MAEKGHYPLDNQILRMYAEGKKIEAEFGVYIASKENLQRAAKELPRGQFYMSVGAVCKDLNISRGKAQRIIDLYKESGIIKPIFQYEKWEKKPSIWEVQSVSKSDIQSDTQNDTQSDIQELSNSNAFNSVSDTQSDIQSDTRSGTSKKENIKRKYKNNNNNKKGFDDIINSYTTNEDLKLVIFDFIKMRKANKKVMTDRAVSLMLNKLDKLSTSEDIKIKILEQSIENSWQGVFPLKEIKVAADRQQGSTWGGLKK